MKRNSIFGSLTLVAAGILWLLSSMRIIPSANFWALLHVLPYLLVALGLGLVAQSRWQFAGVVTPVLAVVGLLAAVIFAPQAGWETPPVWGFESSGARLGGGVAGSGVIEAETRPVNGITDIELNYPAMVTILQGESESVTIEADNNLLPQLDTQVNGGILTIENNEEEWVQRVNPSREVKVTITVSDLRSVVLSTAGTLRIENLKVEKLRLQLDGAGNVMLVDLDAQSLEIVLNGVGNITASGKSAHVAAEINGLGSVYGNDLVSSNASAEINGLGRIDLFSQGSLTAVINGLGTIGCFGNPNVERRINGLGSIQNLGE